MGEEGATSSFSSACKEGTFLEISKSPMFHKIKKDLNLKVASVVLTTPNFILFGLFFLIPAILGFYYSFTKYDGFIVSDFVGLNNYKTLFQDRTFLTSLRQTIIYALIAPTLSYTFSLMVSVLMTDRDLVGRNFLKALIYIPSLLSPIIVGITWRFLFGENFGYINFLLEKFGLEAVKWSSSGVPAMATILLAGIWGGLGTNMILILSRMSAIPKDLYESAELDGANQFQKFIQITFPMLKPVTFFVMLTSTIGAFKEFALVQTLTDGGPGDFTNFFVLYIYKTGFERQRVGYASAASMVLLVMLLVLSVIQMKFTNGGRIEE